MSCSQGNGHYLRSWVWLSGHCMARLSGGLVCLIVCKRRWDSLSKMCRLVIWRSNSVAAVLTGTLFFIGFSTSSCNHHCSPSEMCTLALPPWPCTRQDHGQSRLDFQAFLSSVRVYYLVLVVEQNTMHNGNRIWCVLYQVEKFSCFLGLLCWHSPHCLWYCKTVTILYMY